MTKLKNIIEREKAASPDRFRVGWLGMIGIAALWALCLWATFASGFGGHVMSMVGWGG